MWLAAQVKIKKGPAKGNIYDADVDWNDEATLTEGSYMFSKVWLCSACIRWSKSNSTQIHPTAAISEGDLVPADHWPGKGSL